MGVQACEFHCEGIRYCRRQMHTAVGIEELCAFGHGNAMVAGAGADKGMFLAPGSDVFIEQFLGIKLTAFFLLPLIQQKGRNGVNASQGFKSAQIKPVGLVLDEDSTSINTGDFLKRGWLVSRTLLDEIPGSL